MALRLSTGMRTALLGTWGFKELFAGGFISIYTGSQPLSGDSTETGTLLCRISTTSGTDLDDGINFGTAGSGVLPKDGNVWSGVVLADGVAGWFRLYASSGTYGCTGTNGTAIRLDGAVGLSSDLSLNYTSLDTGATLSITQANVTQPAS